MKKIIIGLALALLTLGCAKEYDDSTLTARVDQLEKDVRDIKAQLKDLNSQAAGVNAAIEAWKAGGFVQSITDVKENNVVVGYTITFVGGQTVTIYHGQKGDQGNPGNPGNPGDPGHSPVVTIGQVEGYDGLYWLVDGAPLKVNDKPVPVTVLPTFTINAEGHLIATVDGVETDLGTVMGVGESLIDEITPGTDAVTFKLADGTTFDVPMAKAFKLVIETKDFEVAAGATKEIAYDVQNADESTVVEVFANNYAYKASVDATAKKIKVTVPDPFVPGEVLVWAQNDKGLTSLVKLSFIQAAGLIIVTDETNYQTISKDGGDVVVNLTSNVDVDVKQPAEDWVHAAITKAEYKLTLTLDANPTTEPREADIEIIRKDNGNTVQTIKIIQLGGELIMPTAAVDDVLWSETWTGGEAGVSPAAYTQSGTTVFGDFKVKYSSVKPDNGSDIVLYNDNQFGYDTENLLLSKNGGTWTISGIPSGNAKKALLTIKVNAKREPALSSTTEGVSIGTRNVGAETQKPYTYNWEISFTDVKLFNLTFTLTNSSNIRIDDVVLKVTEAGEGGGETPKVATFERLWGKYPVGLGQAWTTEFSSTGSFIKGNDRTMATDGEYVYVAAASSSTKGILAINIADPTQIKEVNVTGVEGGLFATACVRTIYNPTTGKYMLLVGSLAYDGDYTFNLYAYTNGIDQAPTKVKSWATNNRRFGDFFTVVGDWSNGEVWIRMNDTATTTTIIFKISNGVLGDPIGGQIGYAASAGMGSCYKYSVDATQVLVETPNIGLFYNYEASTWISTATGQLWASKDQSIMCRKFGVTPFEFNGVKYIAYTQMGKYNDPANGARGRLKVIADQGSASTFLASIEADDVIYECPIQNSNDNASSVEEFDEVLFIDNPSAAGQVMCNCSVVPVDDGVIIAAHVYNVGLSVFKLSLK